MPPTVVVAPIATDRLRDADAWLAQLAGEQRPALATWQKRHGVDRLAAGRRGEGDEAEVVFVIDVADGDELAAAVDAGSDPFDRWMCDWLRHLHDASFADWLHRYGAELELDTAPGATPFREWPS